MSERWASIYSLMPWLRKWSGWDGVLPLWARQQEAIYEIARNDPTTFTAQGRCTKVIPPYHGFPLGNRCWRATTQWFPEQVCGGHPLHTGNKRNRSEKRCDKCSTMSYEVGAT